MFGILNNSITSQVEDIGLDDTLLASIFRAPLSINSKRIRNVSETLALTQVSNISDVQRWEFESGLYSDKGSAEMLLSSVINDVDSYIYVRPPFATKLYYQADGMGFNRSYPSEGGRDMAFSVGIATKTGSTDNAWSSTVTTVNLLNDGFSRVFVGDFIRFENDTKLHLITGITHSNNLTATTISIFPRLRYSVTSGDKVYLGASATCRMYYDISNIQGISYTDGVLADPGTVRLVEAL